MASQYRYHPGFYIPEAALAAVAAASTATAAASATRSDARAVTATTTTAVTATATATSPAAGGFWEGHYVDVKDFGAVGDYDPVTHTGTDDTTAIQDAIDSTAFLGPNEGKVVLLSGGRYMTTAPLDMPGSTALLGLSLTRPMALGAAGGYASSIEFHGGSTDNCIEASGSSRVWVQGFTVFDRRTSPTSGDGIHFEPTVNLTTIREMDFHGFPTGSAVRVTAASGSASDNVNIDDLWTLGCKYGVWVSNIDNNTIIRNIKADTPSGSPMLAVVRVGALDGTALVQSIKHENSSSSCVTVLCELFASGVVIDSVISRVGTGGAVLRIDGDSGRGVTARGLQRENSGTLIEVINHTMAFTRTGTVVTYWSGPLWGYRLANAGWVGQSSVADDVNRIYLEGKLYAASSASNVSTEGKVSIAPDTTGQRGLTVRMIPSATADALNIYDATSAVFRVGATGAVVAREPLYSTRRTAVADTNYTILTTDRYVPVTSLTAPRTLTLPSAVAVGAGFPLIIKDESGAAGTYNVTVARVSTQLIDGATTAVISSNYGVLRLESTGSNWSVI